MSPPPRAIGPGGTGARVTVGLLLMAIVLQGELSTRGINLASLAFGLAGITAVVLALAVAAGAAGLGSPGGDEAVARSSEPGGARRLLPDALVRQASGLHRRRGPLLHGASMLLAAWRGYAGCGVVAVSNWLLHRDD